MQIEIHPNGTAINIDHENNRITYLNPTNLEYDRMTKTFKQTEKTELVARETYSLDAEWLQDYKTCRVCGKALDDQRFAFALWQHQKAVCSVECYRAEELKRYACCDKAKQYGCVCVYATECPDHGIRHFGSHD